MTTICARYPETSLTKILIHGPWHLPGPRESLAPSRVAPREEIRMKSVNRYIPLAGALWSRTARGLAAAGLTLAALTVTASPSQALVGGQYTGSFSVSATTVKLGTTFTATQQAISQGDTQTPGITVGIRRLGFTVVASKPPRTGICRIAGSATCSFLLLAPHETQTYTLTLAPTTAGTYQLTGWTTQPIAGGSGGTVQTVTITVTP